MRKIISYPDNAVFAITKGEYYYSNTLSPKDKDQFYLFLKLKLKFQKDMSKYPFCGSINNIPEQKI